MTLFLPFQDKYSLSTPLRIFKLVVFYLLLTGIWILTGIHDEGTHDYNLGYYDTFDLLITFKKIKEKIPKISFFFILLNFHFLQKY